MPAHLVVRLTPSFQRNLEALPRAAQERILEAIRAEGWTEESGLASPLFSEILDLHRSRCYESHGEDLREWRNRQTRET